MTPVNDYFSGEKTQCLIGIVLGLISIAVAIYSLIQLQTELYKGIAYPFLIISVLLIIICAGVVWRTPRDIARVNQFVQQEPEKIHTEEIPRMKAVMKNFKIIKIVEACLFVIALGIILYASSKNKDLLKGIGLGLAIQSAIMYGFDYFAHARGKIYWEFLQSL